MDTDKTTRLTLLQKIRNRHDEGSWEDFTNYYRGYIFVVLQKIIGNHHDCQDLTQEVLLKAWKALADYQYRQGECKFRTWLCRICRNSALNFLRQNKRDQLSAAFEIQDCEAMTEAEIDTLATAEWEQFVSELAWDNVAKDFSENVRECFRLSGEGLTSAAIGARLNLAESSVRVNKKRLTQALYREILRLDRELN